MTQKLWKSEYPVSDLLAILLFSSFFVLFDHAYSSVAILFLTFLTVVYMIVKNSGRLTIRITYFHVWMIALASFCLFSSIWAWDTENAITKGKTIFSMFLCYSMAYLCYQEYDSVDSLLKAVLWGGNIVVCMIVLTFGVHGVISLLVYDDRLSEQYFLNSNVVGMLCAMSVQVNIYYILKTKKIHWWNLFIIFNIVMIAATGSRQALVVLAGGIVLLLLMFVMRGRTPGETVILFLVSAVLLAAVIAVFARIPAFSGIYKRILSLISALTGVGKTDRSATTRLALIHAGIKQFKQNPILGVGMGSGHLIAWKYVNRTYYLHNNFVEVLSGGGITGFLLYYSIYFYILCNMIRYHRYSTLETSLCATILMMLLVDDYATVSYYEKTTYFYLMIGMLEVEKLRKAYRNAIPVTPTVQCLKGR